MSQYVEFSLSVCFSFKKNKPKAKNKKISTSPSLKLYTIRNTLNSQTTNQEKVYYRPQFDIESKKKNLFFFKKTHRERDTMPKKTSRRAPGMIFIGDKSTSLEVAARKKIIEETQRLKDDAYVSPLSRARSRSLTFQKHTERPNPW